MPSVDPNRPVSRRQALALSGGVVGGLLVSGCGRASASRDRGNPSGPPVGAPQSGSLPRAQMEKILDAQADVSEGLIHFSINRTDAPAVRGPQRVPFSGSFEINGDLYFQPLDRGKSAFFNGDLALKPAELNTVIDAIIDNGLVFQAMHQHYFGLKPMWWFIHIRGRGDPLKLAQAMRNVLAATSTPFPQEAPVSPASPLSVKQLEQILRGNGTVGDEGVVTVDVPRTDKVTIDGVRVNPGANISTNIQFRPLTGAATAAAAPDFSMTSAEIMPVTSLMRRLGWRDHCLYNQETGEDPQLYFSHMLKVGEPYTLAREIRQGLDRTAVK